MKGINNKTNTMTFLKFGMLGVTDFSDTLALDLQLRCAEGWGGGTSPISPWMLWRILSVFLSL